MKDLAFCLGESCHVKDKVGLKAGLPGDNTMSLGEIASLPT